MSVNILYISFEIIFINVIYSLKCTATLYRPPSSDLACFARTIGNMLVKASNQYERICRLGDFNIPSVNWKSELCSSNITSQSMFRDVINQFSFQQLNTVASNVKGKHARSGIHERT